MTSGYHYLTNRETLAVFPSLEGILIWIQRAPPLSSFTTSPI